MKLFLAIVCIAGLTDFCIVLYLRGYRRGHDDADQWWIGLGQAVDAEQVKIWEQWAREGWREML